MLPLPPIVSPLEMAKFYWSSGARNPHEDTWMFPAGFVSFGEHPKETVVRELQEETGLNAKVVKLIDVIQVDDDPRSLGHFGFFYAVTVTGKIKPTDKEENSHQQIIKQLEGVFLTSQNL